MRFDKMEWQGIQLDEFASLVLNVFFAKRLPVDVCAGLWLIYPYNPREVEYAK